MKYLDLTFADPERNLACDEALLNWCETHHSDEGLLRTWHPQSHFIVLGHSNKFGSEVDALACDAASVRVLRRISGGGAVVQGPGCFNYSLFLNTTIAKVNSVNECFDYVLRRHQRLFERLKKVDVRVDGISDLTVGGRKFSGNAQYRKRTFVLVHGTFLLDFDLALMERYLRLPARQPEYRGNRSHREFVTNLKLSPRLLRTALIETWDASESFTATPLAAINTLARQRYETKGWLEKF
jgi:lipoate-protein ligase A